jgi:23S rRNA pseudouridine1911/1915/1917 synthase
MLKKEIFFINEENSKKRIDIVISEFFYISRSLAQKYISEKLVYKNNEIIRKPNIKVHESDIIEIKEKEILEDDQQIKSNIEIEIIFENNDFLIINKPPFISVHKSNYYDKSFTISDWLIQNNYWNDVVFGKEKEARPGIVHRLDKNTSGILILAKNFKTQLIFCNLFKNREIRKEYIAFTEKSPIKENGIISYNIARDITNPTKMTHNFFSGRKSETEYNLIEKRNNFSVIRCLPKTGRTHQIRVHLSAIDCSIIGDEIYGEKSNLINRQALHSEKISFKLKEKEYTFSANLYCDMEKLLNEDKNK